MQRTPLQEFIARANEVKDDYLDLIRFAAVQEAQGLRMRGAAFDAYVENRVWNLAPLKTAFNKVIEDLRQSYLKTGEGLADPMTVLEDVINLQKWNESLEAHAH